jgi:hypothetical protein
MSSRLDQEREALLQPKRLKDCKETLEKMGFVVNQFGATELRFVFNGSLVKFWPYSGWHSGKSIKDGRGFSNLLRQLRKAEEHPITKHFNTDPINSYDPNQ